MTYSGGKLTYGAKLDVAQKKDDKASSAMAKFRTMDLKVHRGEHRRER